MGKEIFLDTSIVVSRLKGNIFRSSIDSHLSGFNFKGASSYSKTEYGNVVLAPVSLMLKKIDHLGTLAAAQEWFANCVPQQQPGLKTWSFNLLTKHYGENEEERTERARLALQSYLRFGTREVDRLVDHVVDGTKCVRAQKRAEKTHYGLRWRSFRCSRSKPLCRIADLFEEHVGLFRAIRDAIASLPENEKVGQLKGFEDTIGEALEDPRVLLDHKKCKSIADTIIAVDSKGFRNFFTQNVKDSRVLCAVMKQCLYYLPSNFQKPIETHDFSEQT